MTRHLEAITAIPGLKVGHWTNQEAATGCTVILCEEGAVASADIRGGAPGTRETDLLRPENLVDRVNAVLLTGGSAFGLDAAGGVMRWLEERGAGHPTAAGPVPIVVAAVLYDLALGRADVRPDGDAGYAACLAAGEAMQEGSVGAGTGATVAKALGLSRAIKGGLGTACEETEAGILVGALAAVNCVGEVIDPQTGVTVAGPRGESGAFVPAMDITRRSQPGPFETITSTTIGVVATDARLTKAQCRRVAIMAQDGLARTIRPAHTPYDGDSVFVLATGISSVDVDVAAIGAIGARVMERAILRGVRLATGLAGIPSAREWAGNVS